MLGQMLPVAEEQLVTIRNPEDAARCVAPDSAATFEEVARRYIAVKEPGWGAHAENTAKSIIGKHLIGNLGHRRVDELTAMEVQLFVNGMVMNNASISLLNKAVEHLRAILDLAQELNLIIRNPMRGYAFKLEYKSRKRKSERYLSLDECRALLSQLSGRDHLIIRLFIQLGVRPEELFALRRNDVHDEFITIDEVVSRGQTREIHPGEHGVNLYLPPGLRRELRVWMASNCGNGEDWLFPAGRPRGTNGVSPISQADFLVRVLKPAAKRAGISDLNTLALRRTCATHFGKMASAEVVQAQMRLSSPFTTFAYSQQSIPDSLKSVAVAFEAELFGRAERRATSSARRNPKSGRLDLVPTAPFELPGRDGLTR